MTRLLIVGAAALVVAMPAAFAQPAPPTPPGVSPGTAAPVPVQRVRPVPPIAEMHTRIMSDRVITRDEVVRHVREFFPRLDTDHDGFITHQELETFHEKMGRMEGMDREMAERFREHPLPMPDRGSMFDRLDTNHDGMISRQEYMAAQPQVRERQVFIMRNGNAPDGPGQPGMPQMMKMHMHGAGMHMGGFGGHMFETADTNHDGRVSVAEAEAAALAHFDKADLNHDGKITPDEREQAHHMLQRHRPS